MSRSLPIDYQPLPVPYDPRELPRYLEQELYRISQSLISQPVALTVDETSVLQVTTVANWQRLFLSQTASWDIPGGGWDPVLAEWTCPQQGLYFNIADLRVEPYGAGNKTYYAGVRIVIDRADGSPDVVVQAVDSGQDDFDLGVTLPLQTPIFFGDVVHWEATVVHDQFIGDATINSSTQLFRVSA
jgi:hypothetical protein